MNITRVITILAQLAMLVVSASSCSGSGTATNVSMPAPRLTVVGNSSIALGGSELLTITMQNAEYLTNQVAVSISISDESVAHIVENNCSQTLLNQDAPQCTVMLGGARLGSARVTVSASDYPTVIKDVSVLRQWGGLGRNLDLFQTFDIYNDNVYAYLSDSMVYKSQSGFAWQLVGDGVIARNFSSMAVSDNSVCVATWEASTILSSSAFITCSKNGSSWYDLPPQLGNYIPWGLSIYNDNVYLMVNTRVDIGSNWFTMIESCSLYNCVQWKHDGESTTMLDDFLSAQHFYNSTAYIQQDGGLYRQYIDGSWQLYGTYTSGVTNNHFAFSSTGAVFLPENDNLDPPYTQHIYYLNSANVGESFTEINDGLLVNQFGNGRAIPSIVLHDNTVYASLGDGKVYTATRSGSSWSPWQQVGDSQYPLWDLHISQDGKKLYAIVNAVDFPKSRVYVYTLPDNQ